MELAALSIEPVSPFEAQAAVHAAIDSYRTPTEIAQAHANCLGALGLVHDTESQVFLQSCLIALRHRLSFGIPISGSSAPPRLCAVAESVRVGYASSPPCESSAGNLSR